MEKVFLFFLFTFPFYPLFAPTWRTLLRCVIVISLILLAIHANSFISDLYNRGLGNALGMAIIGMLEILFVICIVIKISWFIFRKKEPGRIFSISKTDMVALICFGVFLILNANNFCYSQFVFYTTKQRQDIALEKIIIAQGNYKTLEEFYRLNPDCCITTNKPLNTNAIFLPFVARIFNVAEWYSLWLYQSSPSQTRQYTENTVRMSNCGKVLKQYSLPYSLEQLSKIGNLSENGRDTRLEALREKGILPPL